ncbi:GH24700 [Drosophila grimshawi]|uniref:GH24700 n=2 Tax=Drosophila grimshawi TaxID=7222 RepID=B4JMV9_DROGR|nr:GH24700 [Drosophila grimshawi]
MELEDSRSTFRSTSESPSNSCATTPIKETAGDDDETMKSAQASGGRNSAASSRSSHSDRSKTKKKSSSSSDSSSSGGGSSSSSSSSSGSDSSSSSEDDDDDDSRKPPSSAAMAAAAAAAAAAAVAAGNVAVKVDADGDGSGNGDGDVDADANVDADVDAAATTETVSSKKSQSSSVRSRSNSREPIYNQAAVDLNISHEDLSDVSDIDMERQAQSKNSNSNSAKANQDEEEEGAISDDSLPAVRDSPTLNGKSRIEKQSTENSKDSKDSDGTNGLDDLVKPPHDDDALDFEAEEGECPELAGKSEADAETDAGANSSATAANGGNELNKNAASQSQSSPAKANDHDDVVVVVDDDGDGAVAGGAECAKKKKKDEELEEGEVSDEDEKRPEETEPKPVCRFYTRGQCTWGMSCRFLHPGVTDKGNYTMFESLVRSVPMQSGSAGGVGGASSSSRAPSSSAYNSHMAGVTAAGGDYHDYRTERPAALHHRAAGGLHHAGGIYAGVGGATGHHDARSGLLMSEVPVVVENAWERGLRTAKEMMRKANKRKEQDMDFEDKKMNLTLSPDELEKDPYYLKERGNSPSVARELPPNNPISHGNPRALLPPVYSMYGQPPDRYRAPYMPPVPYEVVDVYGRMARYRELPPHRMPQYEDDRRLRPAREVIVQRVEAVARGDEWSDPWMRSKSIGRGPSYDRDDRRRPRRRSYSSNSSYSSSNSSQSDSSSDSSRSSSASEQKRRYSHKLMSGAASRRHAAGRARSPSQIPRRPRRSSKGSASSAYKRSALEKRLAVGGTHSPASKRKKLSPAPKKFDKIRRRGSSSSSDSADSSGTSYSDSDSGSSSSDSSSGSRDTPQKRVRATDKALNERKLIKKPSEQSAKKRSPISIEIKKPSNMVGVSALASPPAHSPASDKEKDSAKDKEKDKDKDKDGKKSRREDLLKQLRAVEDAIAKKRSKLT